MDVVQIDRFPLLQFVPHEHPLGRERQLSLARQVIPAGDGEHVPDAHFGRGTGEIELRGLENDERRGYEQVRPLL
jgi:hypothetical protein